MNKIFFIFDKKANKIIETKENWSYRTLGKAKCACKNLISKLNKTKKPREERIFWTDYEIIESEPVELQRHKL